MDVVEEVEHKSPLVIKRNYRKVYQWAQRVSPVAILFLSTEWVKSANCRFELDDLIGLCNDEGTREGRTVFVVWLDPNTEVLEEKEAKNYDLKGKLKDLKEKLGDSQCSEYDLSAYQKWYKTREKAWLHPSAIAMVELKDRLGNVLGQGSERCFIAEMKAMRDRPEHERRDPQFKPLRNRFQPLCQRRIDIGTAEEGDLMARIPRLGEKLGPRVKLRIWQALAVRKQGGETQQLFNTLVELRDFLKSIPGIGPLISEYVCCFVTCYGRRPAVHPMVTRSRSNAGDE